MNSFDPRIAEALGREVPLRAEVAPVWSDVVGRAERGKRRARRRWRPVLVAAVVTIGLAGVGVAIADGFGIFDGIASVQHPQTGADVIDPATRAYMEPGGGSSMPIIAGLEWDTSRHLGQLADGRNVYVISTTFPELCFVVGPPNPEWQCRDPLSGSHPTADFAYTQGGKPWTAIGVALDGVAAVSFDANGREVTVPVKDNFWTYTTSDDDALGAPLRTLTVHFADGTTTVDDCPMC
jgi:hypothetical protein